MTSRPNTLPRGPRQDARVAGAALLAGVMLALAVYAGPHLLEHLLGQDTDDADHCALCAAIHGMRSGAPLALMLLVPALLFVRLSPLPCPPPIASVAIPSPAPRGPPVIG